MTAPWPPMAPGRRPWRLAVSPWPRVRTYATEAAALDQASAAVRDGATWAQVTHVEVRDYTTTVRPVDLEGGGTGTTRTRWRS